jgi:DNA-binding transcriptional regulator GbsR (MarR family)
MATDKEQKTVERFIEELSVYYGKNGIPRIAGKILALLMTAPEPLSAEMIALQLDVSRSSVSTNIKLLAWRGAIEQVTRKGDRLRYFRYSWDSWEQAILAQLRGFGEMRDIARRAAADLGADHPARGRIMELDGWIEFFLSHYKDMLASWPAKGGRK